MPELSSVKLSLLDLSPVMEGSTPREALANSLDLFNLAVMLIGTILIAYVVAR